MGACEIGAMRCSPFLWLLPFLGISCSFLVISRAPKAADQRYARRVVRDDPTLRLLGDHRRISHQGWNGDTLAVVCEAVHNNNFIGPPVLPFVPFATGYGAMGDGAYGGEVSSTDRMWITVLLTVAPGHTFAIDPCAAEWVGGKDTLRGAGMVRTDGAMATAAFIPLAYRCDTDPGGMQWTNAGTTPERIFLMVRFQPGMHLEGGTRWTLQMPCRVNGVDRLAEFHYRYGQWIQYVPITKVNG